MTARTILVALLILCLSHPVRAAKLDTPAQFEPDTEAGATASLEGTTWVADGGIWKVWLKQVDDQERLNFIERITGLAIDPFAGRPDQPPTYLSFLLVLENQGGDGLYFNPHNCWLRTNRNKILLPRGLADLSFNFRVTGREFPVAYERVQEALFERAVSVAPGERIVGLLVYDQVHQKTKTWSLSFRLTHSNGKQAAFSVPYRRTDLKKKKRGKGIDP